MILHYSHDDNETLLHMYSFRNSNLMLYMKYCEYNMLKYSTEVLIFLFYDLSHDHFVNMPFHCDGLQVN